MDENKTKRYLVQCFDCDAQVIHWDQIDVSCGPSDGFNDAAAVKAAFLILRRVDDAAYCDVYDDPQCLGDYGLFVCRVRL